ncbi:MAG TPA: hypothetical protein VFQ68_27760 [Streptosporangiaceae bacterium]|nr:hypothetical protein [Streptosporangiaceae bacterium]
MPSVDWPGSRARLQRGAEQRSGQFGQPRGAVRAQGLPRAVGQPVGPPFHLIPAVATTLSDLACRVGPAAGRQPRDASRSLAARQSCSLQPRLVNTAGGAAPMAANDTSASHGSRPAATSAGP